MGPAISEGSFKSLKLIYHSTRLAMESSKIMFSSVAQMVSVSHVFVYSAIDVNKTAIVPLAKLPPSYTTVVVYSRDDQEMGFLPPKYHPKTSLKFLS